MQHRRMDTCTAFHLFVGCLEMRCHSNPNYKYLAKAANDRRVFEDSILIEPLNLYEYIVTYTI